jgi:hypothetical protein
MSFTLSAEFSLFPSGFTFPVPIVNLSAFTFRSIPPAPPVPLPPIFATPTAKGLRFPPTAGLEVRLPTPSTAVTLRVVEPDPTNSVFIQCKNSSGVVVETQRVFQTLEPKTVLLAATDIATVTLTDPSNQGFLVEIAVEIDT